MISRIPSSMDIARAMDRGAKSGLATALQQVADKASRVAPFANKPVTATTGQHLRDGFRVIGPVQGVNGAVSGKVAFQVHSLHPSNEGFSYARARHEGFYYVTPSGERNYDGRGTRFPATGTFRFKHAADPNAEHRFLYHAARTTRFQVRSTIGRAIAASLRSSL